MKKKVLIISAHPDDDILGCGGFISKFKKKYDFRIVFIAEGSSCRFNDLIKDKDKIAKTIETRNSYAIDALRSLSVKDVKFYNLPCGRLNNQPIIEINKIIENEISKYKPNIVFTHAEKDTNNDHRVIYKSTMMATRPGVFETLESVISYEVLSSTEWNYSEVFSPNHFVALDKSHVKEKWNALKCFTSEIKKFPHPRSEQGIITHASYRGMQSGFKFAEAFKIIRYFQK